MFSNCTHQCIQFSMNEPNRDGCHYVIDKVLPDEITTYFVKSEDQLVDILKNSLKTKNLKV